ncbi:MAG: hypothetical protein BGO55_09185 [Sphingobacteriales bacterium 50-39]|nr:hypothetical protein [Sphingobacteriales bacterium]OJW57719.1 MAG: hypothetical protein BGO55_09185 [Sphingobacteriales bacterium 50-39]
MGKITGRPKKAVTRDKNIGFFVTQAQYFIIQQKAARAGVNISDYMRQASVFGEIRSRWSFEERDIFKKMVGMSNDIHELVTMARQEGVVQCALYFGQYGKQIDEALKRLGDAK